MSADPQGVQALFARAIEIADQSEREKFLADQCSGNVELYERVAKLLVAFDGSKGFLDQPTHELAATQLDIGGGYHPGHVIAGRYKLLEAIGEGGMGTVWVAEQTQPVRRKVALKLVKPGMDSKQVLARFDAERQALALMDHPNIAKVFDGGVTDKGRPFFAMELVKGMPLTQYCDQMRLAVEERLKLFVPICQAVQHAHQKGIIHRDLKPSNVLICMYDGKPIPKVIDFGLAKAMHQPLTEQTVHTGFGMMIGTPLYMSPEQAEHNNLDVDTRTDVYSLGVMLYELLTGSTPLEKAQFKDAAFGEILRLIKEVEPPKPSTRVSSSAQLPNIAAQRNLDPDKLGRSIRGDLDWIVMKAIDKERDRRYETANGLGRDIERFLNTEAVEACPPSTGYRLRRLARKHRAVITSVAAFATVLVLGAGLSLWQAVRATNAESLASQRLTEVQIEQSKTREALDDSQQSERRALESESAAIAAREAEEQAKTAEAEQRRLAEQQRDEAQRLQVEATAKSNELEIQTEQQRRVIYASEMSQVRIEAQRGNLARMREILLDQLPIDGKPDLRGMEWNYWYRYLNPANVVMKLEQASVDEAGSAQLTVLPGGGYIAWSDGQETTFVDLAKGNSWAAPFAIRHYGDRTQFSRTGRAVVGQCSNQEAYYPSNSSEAVGALPAYEAKCSVFDSTGRERSINYPERAFSHISAINITSDGTRVVVIGNDVAHERNHPLTRICVWNVDTGKLILNEVYNREINRVSFSPDAERVVAHLCHGTLQRADSVRDVVVIIDLASGKEIGVARHDDDIDAVYWLPNSDRLLMVTLGFSGANRKQLLAWSTNETGQRPILLSKENMPDYPVGTCSNDGHTLAITSHKVNYVRLFDTLRGEMLETLQTGGKGVVTATFSNDDRELLATTVDGEVLRWDLGRRNDLFALRSKALPRLSSNGFAVSVDQALLGVAHADGTLAVRTRDGDEVILREGVPNSVTGHVLMKFCPNNRFFAFRTNIDFDGKQLPQGNGLLELYDLREQKRLWQRYCKTGVRDDEILGSTLEFTANGEHLVHYEMERGAVRIESATGIGKQFALANAPSTTASVAWIQRNSQTGLIFLTFLERFQTTGETQLVQLDLLTGMRSNIGFAESEALFATPSPDGRFCSVMKPQPRGGEIWDLRTKERILVHSGSAAIFSPNAESVALLNFSFAGNSPRQITGVAVWDLENRQKLCELPLEGDTPDVVRFSQNGARLLTLHGQRTTSGGKIPRGRLWDVSTGREILDLPIADVNHYIWDLLFDSTGNQLTALLFNKAAGTLNGGMSTIYDARPLEPAVDHALAADRLVSHLKSKYALKPEWIDEVNSITGLKDGIRIAALGLIRDTSVDADAVAGLIGDVVGTSTLTSKEYQRGVDWAEELLRLEPSAARSRALLAAAYYRAERPEEALQILEQNRVESVTTTEDSESVYRATSFAIRALLHMQDDQSEKAQDAIEQYSRILRTVPRTNAASDVALVQGLLMEAASLIPRRVIPTPTEQIPNRESLERSADLILQSNKLTNIRYENWMECRGRRLAAYDTNSDGKIDKDEFIVALEDIHRFGRPCIAASQGQYSIAARVEFLDRSIRAAPRYLTLRFARSWILATSTDPQLRNAEMAIEDAKMICEQTNYLDATYLEALAAGYAAAGEFASAVHWQEEAIRLFSERKSERSKGPQGQESRKQRLLSYQQHRSVNTHELPDLDDMVTFYVPGRADPVDIAAPLLAPDVVFRSRRIPGWGAAWSPDGKQIVRNLKYGEPHAALEIINLESGEIRQLCSDGVDPIWSAGPGERIFFVRGPGDTQRTPFNESIWKCDPNGENLSKMTEGGFPSLSQDGRLFVRHIDISNQGYFLKSISLDNGQQVGSSRLNTENSAYYPPVSPNGKLMAVSTSGNPQLRIVDFESQEVLRSIDLHSRGIVELGGWSPNSRYFAYGSTNPNLVGIWLLDVTNGELRLLADCFACNPRWSPDGCYIAADERDKNQIVILDVSSLHLEKGLADHQPPAKP